MRWIFHWGIILSKPDIQKLIVHDAINFRKHYLFVRIASAPYHLLLFHCHIWDFHPIWSCSVQFSRFLQLHRRTFQWDKGAERLILFAHGDHNQIQSHEMRLWVIVRSVREAADCCGGQLYWLSPCPLLLQTCNAFDITVTISLKFAKHNSNRSMNALCIFCPVGILHLFVSANF